MSTSLLYHTCGIRNYEYRSTAYVDGAVLIHIDQPRERLRCSRCGSADVGPRGTVQRVFRSVPIGSKPVWIRLDVPRVHCAKCGITRQVRIGFADEQRRHTRAFARYALELTRFGTIRDVALHLGVGWDLIKDLKKRDLHRRYHPPRLRDLKHLAIDELCIGRGHRYRTLVLDLDTGDRAEAADRVHHVEAIDRTHQFRVGGLHRGVRRGRPYFTDRRFNSIPPRRLSTAVGDAERGKKRLALDIEGDATTDLIRNTN